MPEGISVEINSNSVAAELRTFPALEAQLEALVPNTLSEKQFWINYFSHKHAIKLNVAQEAERLASLNPDEAGFIQRRGASAHLRQQFIEAMRESGVHLSKTSLFLLYKKITVSKYDRLLRSYDYRAAPRH